MTRKPVVIKSLTLNNPIYRELQLQAIKKGINLQELLRAIVIPEYLQNHTSETSKKRSEAMKKGWETRRKKQEALELAAKNEEFPPYQEYPAGPTQ